MCMTRPQGFLLTLACLLLLVAAQPTFADPAPLVLKSGLFDSGDDEKLGLPMAPERETFTVFSPKQDDYAYNHGAVITGFKGRLLMQWQSSHRDEDAPETTVMYAWADASSPGKWSTPKALYGPGKDGIVTNGGWWSDGETLVSFLNVWSTNALGQRIGRTEYMLSRDGMIWSDPKPVLGDDGSPVKGVIEQDPIRLSTGRVVTAFHIEPGILATPMYTDDPLAIGGWKRGQFENLGQKDGVSRELEPSAYIKRNGNLVMLFRDQFSSFKTLASESMDDGESWSVPALADFPDSRSKQSAGNLPNGSVFRVNNPREDRRRYPLVVTLSDNGELFNRAFLVRAGGDDMQPQRFEGKYKRAGYSYPKSAVIGDYLYVAYATNKEDIEVTRIPWRELLKK